MKNPLAIASAIILLLFGGAALYCYPQYDDFTYAIKALQHGFWATQVSEYNGWNGRYLATALLTSGPLIWGTITSYRLIPVALLVGFFLSIYILLRVLSARLALALFSPSLSILPPQRRLPALEWAVILSAVYVLIIPDVAQAFYWSAASLTYTLPLIYFNIALAIYFSRWSKILKFASMAVLVVAIIGSDETIMIIADYVLFMELAFNCFVSRNRGTVKINYFLVGLLLVAVAASLFVVVAPGNSVRGAYFENGHKVVRTIGNLFAYTLVYPLRFMSLPLVACAVNFFITEDEFIAKISSFLRPQRFKILLFWLGITFVACFPSSWAMGGQPNTRTQNMILYFIMIGLIPILVAFAPAFKTRFAQFSEYTQLHFWPLKSLPLALVVSLLMCTNMIQLVKGYSSSFQKYSENWQQMIAGAPDRMLETNKPKTVFVDDLNNVAPEVFMYFKTARPEFFK